MHSGSALPRAEGDPLDSLLAHHADGNDEHDDHGEQTTEEDGIMTRITLPGVLGGEAPLSAEDLRGRGQTQSEANRNLVQQQAQELAMTAFRGLATCLFCCFFCIFIPLLLSVFAVMIWAAIATDQDNEKSCDVPLHVYVWGFMALLCWISWCQSVFIKFCLGYDPAQDGPTRPRRVWAYYGIYLVISIGWNAAGVYWVHSAKTCPQTAPHMYLAAKVLVFLQLSAYVVFAFLFVSFSYLVWAVRTGVIELSNNRGAPPKFCDELEVLVFDAESFDDNPYPEECCICMEKFSAEDTGEKAIVKTPCGHIFHKACMVGWMRAARSCPICREDLVAAVQGEGSSNV